MNTLKQLQKALHAIEAGLMEELSIEMLSRIAGMSIWHFQQCFYAAVGEPVAVYLQKRRLAAAAKQLHSSRASLADIAKAYRFGHQDELSRAFKAHWKIDPLRSRRGSCLLDVGLRPVEISAESLRERFGGVELSPEMLNLPARKFAGLQGTFIGALSPRANHLEVIPALWMDFDDCLPDLGLGEVEQLYGLTDMPVPERQAEFDVDQLMYLAGVEVDRNFMAPQGFKCWWSQPGDYVKFTYKGAITEIGEFMQAIYGYWLPTSGYERRPGPEMEVYDERFGDGGADSELDILIPVVKV